MAQRFEGMYPTIARWVTEFGWIEIGQDDVSRSFIRAMDAGGMVWEGQEHYATLDDALQDLEAGLTAWMREQHL
jgi:hypothetical protein